MMLNLFKKKHISNATHVECPNCAEISTVDCWNQIVIDTYGERSPDIRNAALNKKNSFPYQCPACFKGYSAHKMKFSTNNNELLEKNMKEHATNLQSSR